MTIGRPFKKGQSGNPGGRPKVIAEVKELARAHTGEAIETLVSIMTKRRQPRRREILLRMHCLIVFMGSRCNTLLVRVGRYTWLACQNRARRWKSGLQALEISPRQHGVMVRRLRPRSRSARQCIKWSSS